MTDTEECNFHLRGIGSKPSTSRVPNTMRLKLGITRFGRGQNNDFYLDSEKLKNFISRQHAEIHGTRNKENGDIEFILFDRGLNGTFINDIKVNKTSALEMGDKVTFGHTNGYKLSPGQYASQPTSEFQFILEEAQNGYPCLSPSMGENSVSDSSSQGLLERLIESQNSTTLLKPWSAQVNGQTIDAEDGVSEMDQECKEKINAKGDNSLNIRTADSCGVIKKDQLCREQIVQQDFLYQEKNMSQRNGCTYKQLENRDSPSPAKKTPKSPKKRGGKCKTDQGKPSTLSEKFISDNDPSFQAICDKDTSIRLSEKNTENSEFMETLPYESSTPSSSSKSPLKNDINTPTYVKRNIAKDTGFKEELDFSDSEQVTPESDKKATSFARKIFQNDIKSNNYRNVKKVQRSTEHTKPKKNECSPKMKIVEIASKKVSDDPYLFSEEDSSSDGESKRKKPRLAITTSKKTGGQINPPNKRKFSSKPEATDSRTKSKTKKPTKTNAGLEEGVQWYEEEMCDALACKKPKSKRVQWVQCDDCDKWYHTACVHCSYDQVKDFDIGFSCGCT